MRQKGDKREQERVAKLYVHEENCYNNGSKLVAGVDEAGRGPLAGPVVASAVILPPLIFLPGLNDSKLVAEPKRTKLSREIAARAQSVGIGVVDAALIDKHNILEATRMAMKIAIKNLGVTPDFLLIDAVKLADVDIPQLNLIKGDQISASIAAASIIAKVHRDKIMMDIHREFPQYGFNQHKGYGTKAHLEALSRFGPCPYHRRSFAPVKDLPHG